MAFPFPQDWTIGLRFFVIFLRLLGLFIFVTFFGHRTIPARVKVLFAFAFSVALYPLIEKSIAPLPETLGALSLVALRESVIGVLMGFVGYLTFEAIHLAGQFIGYQMGFGASGVLDPGHSRDLSVFVPLQGWIALMVFLVADFHHHLLILFVKSFETTSELHQGFFGNKILLSFILAKISKLFYISMQMASPFCLVLLGANVTLGVLVRLLPQMNLLLFSFPVTIVLGLGTLFVVAPDLLTFFEAKLGDISTDMMELLKVI